MNTAPCVIGIVTWNNFRFLSGLRKTVNSLTITPVKTVIYDNGSTDNSVEWLKTHWPEATLIAGQENLGFAEGHNRLIELAFRAPAATSYVALNSDALLAPDFLEKALPGLDPASRIGAVQPLVLRLDDNMRPTGVIDTTGIAFDVRNRLFVDRHENTSPSMRDEIPGPVFGPSAAVAVYHRDYLEAVKDSVNGYFDRRFFAYYEDVDLAWRARRKGWKAVFIPSAKAYHRRYGSTRSQPEQEKLVYRNRLWLHLKNEGRPPVNSIRAAARELAALARSVTTRSYLRPAVGERFSRYGEFLKDYDPALPKINPSEFPA